LGVEIDGSFGRLDVDLVVEAMNMLGLWKSRGTPVGGVWRAIRLFGFIAILYQMSSETVDSDVRPT